MTGAKKAPVVGALSNSAWARSPLRVTPRDAGPASRDRPALYSRILAGPRFALLRADMGAFGRASTPQLGRIAFGLSGPFWGKFLGQSVGALAALIFNSTPYSTTRAASPMLVNPGASR